MPTDDYKVIIPQNGKEDEQQSSAFRTTPLPPQDANRMLLPQTPFFCHKQQRLHPANDTPMWLKCPAVGVCNSQP